MIVLTVLSLYGFELVSTGANRGCYFHPLFVRDQPELCRRMRRVAVKVNSARAAADAEKETDNKSEDGAAEASEPETNEGDKEE
jgi:hypothetical protein